MSDYIDINNNEASLENDIDESFEGVQQTESVPSTIEVVRFCLIETLFPNNKTSHSRKIQP